MAFYIIFGAYLIGVNIAGLVMLYIQKREKNLSPCERSFSDTNERTDTEKAALNYAAGHNQNTNTIGNNQNYENKTMPAIQNGAVENQNKPDTENNNQGNLETQNSNQGNAEAKCNYNENGVSCNVKLELPVEETQKERKKRLKEQKKLEKFKKKEKKKSKDKTKRPVSDFTIIILAVLGGGIFIYAGMFFMKYKLKNVPFMLAIPTIIGLNIFVIIELIGLIMVWTAVTPK